MITKILNAAGVIIGDMIDEWATKVTRQDLFDTINELKERIRHLEAELDETVDAAAELRLILLDVEAQLSSAILDRDAARGKDPNPYDPYSGCQKEDCVGYCYWCTPKR